MMFITMLIGVVGFALIEDMRLVDAFYMTVITMSTVGYEVLGESGLSDPGKVFVVFLIIFTIGAFFYAISTLTTFIIEGEIRNLFRRYRVSKEISKLEDHIVICGLGRNGKEAAKELRNHGIPFIVLEQEQATIDSYYELYPDTFVLHGDATDEELLKKANITHAKGVITTLADDAENVFVTLTVREFNSGAQVVAKANNQSTISKLRRAGADHVILPNILGGRKMAKIITQPSLVDFVDMITGQGKFQLSLEQVDCEHENGLVGKTLKELDVRSKVGVLVLGMQDSEGSLSLIPK